MNFLKKLFGDKGLTWEEFQKKAAEEKIKVADLSTGEYVSKEKLTRVEQDRDTYKTQLTQANNKIEDFKKFDVEGVKTAAADWEKKYKKLESEKAKEDYRRQLSDFAKKEKFSSLAAQKAFIADLEKKEFKFDGSVLLGYEDFKKAYAETDPGAFAPDKPNPVPVAGLNNGGGEPGAITLEDFRKLSFTDRAKLHGEHPEVYDKMVKKGQ